jgi:hypothetical protein
MRRFVFFTRKYENELRDFAAKAVSAEIIYIEKSDVCAFRGEFTLCFTMKQKDIFCETLLQLLFDITVNENPIYTNSAKLKTMAAGLNDAPVFARELRRLKGYLAGSRELNLDGYIMFRLCELKEKLDSLVYSLVKKIKFGDSP